MASQTERKASPVTTHLPSSLPDRAPIAPGDYAQAVSDLLVTRLHRRTEILPLDQCLGRQLASDLQALYPAPSFANSQMDGYALTAQAGGQANRTFRVGQDIVAGSAPKNLEINDSIAYPIMTGAPLPQGYETVVPVEQSRPLSGPGDDAGFAAQGEFVELAPAPPGQFVRSTGEDIKAGDLLAPAGSTVTPALAGALAAQGIEKVEIYSPPRLLVVTGGDELTNGGTRLQAGRIFDANGPMLQALAQEDGCQVRRVSSTDAVESFINLLVGELARQKPDLVVTSGGISHGKYEVIRRALTHLAEHSPEGVGVTDCWFGHVSQQPAGPQGLALLETAGLTVPVLCLPGNPVSTLISYHLLIRPVLGRLKGQEPERTVGRLVLGERIQAPAQKTQFLRARLRYLVTEGGARQALVEPDTATGSHLLHRAAQANALIELEPGVTYKGGETVRYYQL